MVKRINISLDEASISMLDKMASLAGSNKSSIIRQALVYFEPMLVANLKAQKELEMKQAEITKMLKELKSQLPCV